MKKTLSSIIAAAAILCMSVSVLAAESSVSVKNNVVGAEPVTYTYEAGKSGETAASIKSLMTKLDDLAKQDSVVQTLTITSESADETPVEFKLRLSIPEDSSDVKPEAITTPSPEEYSALDYYNIQVTDTQGNVVYSYEEEPENEDISRTYKDIPLGVLNKTKSAENKIFNITLSINKSLNKSSIAENAEKLDWSIVSDIYIEETPIPMTPAPAVTVTSEPETQTTESPASVQEDKNGVITLASGEYICGTDIEEGRYTMTGEGKVHVYTSKDELKSTIALKKANDTSANGVEEYVINLSDGEKIVVESAITLTPYTAAEATSTPKATKTPSSSSSVKATATPAASSSKSNPKTGDNAPLLGITFLGIIAVGAFVYIEIRKRKHN